MTSDDLATDMQKFVTYLQANGLRPLSMMAFCQKQDGATFSVALGTREMLDELLLLHMAEVNGYELRRKA